MPTRILVADDHPAEVELVINWLRQQGHEATLVSHAERVMILAEQAPPDLILLGSTLSGSGGIETSQRLRRNANTAHIPVVLMTDGDQTTARADAIRAGANDFLLKPLEVPRLQAMMNALLNAETAALGENYRLLEETCQAALLMLPCNLAWLLIIEDGQLFSRMIVTDRGREASNSAGEVFIRLVSEGIPANPVFPLITGNNPLSDAVLNASPLVNITLDQIGTSPGGIPLFRAMSQLRLSYAHFLPLSTRGRVVGMLVAAAKDPHPMQTQLGQKLVMALVNQASTVIVNARLVHDMSIHQTQMRTEQNFRKMVLDTMGDGLVVIDADAIIRYGNNRMLRMSGYTRSELYNQSVGMIFHPDKRDKLVASLKRQGRGTVNFSQQLMTKAGKVLPVLMSRTTTESDSRDLATVLVLKDISEQRRREQELERQGDRLRALNRAAQAVISALTVDDVVMVLLQSVAEIVECANVALFFRDDAHPGLYRVAQAIGPHAAVLRNMTARIGEGIVGEVIADHRPRLVLQVGEEASAIERESNAVIVIPLIVMDQVTGVLEAINKIEGQFARDDLEILENLASAASVAVENARLFAQTQRRVNELSTLLEASAAVSSTLEIGRVLELISRRLVEALNVARCQVGSWDRSTNHLNLMAEVCNAAWEPGVGPQRPQNVMPLLEKTIRAGTASIYRYNDMVLDPGMTAHLERHRVRHAILYPLIFGEMVVGVIELYNHDEQPEFSESQFPIIEESIAHWREMVEEQGAVHWFDRGSLTELYQRVMRASDATWCNISIWEPHDGTIRSVREIGFILHEDEGNFGYLLDQYKAMTYSLTQGAPVTLHPGTQGGDEVERELMAENGTNTGLIVPLLVRGESVGLVRLADTAETRTFDLADISLCQAIANVLANAMENAQLYRSLERRANALQSAYDDLRLADKVKDALLQNLSHELQTPLHQIIMELDLLQTGTFGPVTDEQVEYLGSAMSRVTRLSEIIRDMVSMQTLDIQDIPLDKTRLDAVVRRTVEKLQSKADKVGLELVVTLPPDDIYAWASGDRVAEVLEQLIGNAIKFSPRTERTADRIEIRVEPQQAGRMIEVCIQDFGIGIPGLEFDKIFHRGYQVDGSLTRRFGGAGLGLALARQIVEGHGGKIWVESDVNAGSIFHFTIPKFDAKLQNVR